MNIDLGQKLYDLHHFRTQFGSITNILSNFELLKIQHFCLNYWLNSWVCSNKTDFYSPLNEYKFYILLIWPTSLELQILRVA